MIAAAWTPLRCEDRRGARRRVADPGWTVGKVISPSPGARRGKGISLPPGLRSSETERLGVRGIRLRGGQIVVDDELVEHVALTLLGEGVAHERIVGRGRRWEAGQHRRLRPVQRGWSGAEVPARRGRVTPVAVPVVDGVKVHIGRICGLG